MSGEQGNKRQGRPSPMDPGPASTHDIIANQRRDVLCGVAEVREHDEGGKLQPRVGLRRDRSGRADPRGDAGHRSGRRILGSLQVSRRWKVPAEGL